MARLSEHQELIAAWRALAAEAENGEGWHTIPLALEGPCGIQAGRRFPGNEEALLLAFSKANVPSNQHLPQGKGFSVSRVDLGPESNKCWLAISRRQEGNLGLFTSMVRDLIDTLQESSASSEDRIFQLVFSRIRAWQDFMRRDTDGVLESEAELGLVGELMIMQMICQAGVPPAIPITGWVGPLRGVQDYVLGGGAIEVKATIARTGFIANIDSLDQLDDAQRQPLFLAAVRVRLAESGLTLPEVVDETRTMIADPIDRPNSIQNFFTRGTWMQQPSTIHVVSCCNRPGCFGSPTIFPVSQDTPYHLPSLQYAMSSISTGLKSLLLHFPML